MKIGDEIKVYLNDKDGKRKVNKAKILSIGPTSFRVRLPDGNEVVRKKIRDVIEKKEKENSHANV